MTNKKITNPMIDDDIYSYRSHTTRPIELLDGGEYGI